ncbi:MAG: GC-type dockerin domain-anchored protein [Planctomycetota bacterium]
MAIPQLGTALAAITAFNTAAQIHVFVDDDAPDGGNGLSWESALNDLREAVQLAEDLGEFRGEIRIAGGDYLGDLAEPLEIERYGGQLSGIVLRGGFAGLAMPGAADTRNLSAFITTLRGGGNAPIVQINSAAVLTGPRELGPGPFGALSGINLARATVFDGLRFQGQQGIFVSTFFLTDNNVAVVVRDCEFIDGGTGWGTAEGGGAIGAGGASFLIERSQFLNSRSNKGGAISHQFSAMVIEDCLFDGNGAGSGGAVWSTATALRVDDSTFINNLTTGQNGDGGAIVVLGDGIRRFAHCDFERNSAGRGGAVYIDGERFDIDGSTFVRNDASAEGGAVYNASSGGGTRSVRNTLFDDNSASNGGAMFIDGGIDAVSLASCELVSNFAAEDGGAAYVRPGIGQGVVRLSNCMVSGNFAFDRGGAVFASDVRDTDSDYIGNQASDGAAIHSQFITSALSTFDSNIAVFDGGGIVASGGGLVNVGAFLENFADRGGAIFGPVVVRSSVFDRNSATSQGGALHGPDVVDNGTFTTNRALSLGGAVFGANTIVGSTFTDNSATLRGGAIYDVRFGDRLHVEGNTAGAGGGGIRVEDDFELRRSTVIHNTIDGVSPNEAGEQVVVDGGEGTIDRCLIASGQPGTAGALTLRLDASVLMVESLVGGQLKIDRGMLDARGCTFVAEPGSALPALLADSPSFVVLESTAVAAERPVVLLNNSDGVFIQSYITNGADGIEADPQRVDLLGEVFGGEPGFADPLGPDGDWSAWSDNDYSLRARSRLIDIGFGVGIDAGFFREEDLLGAARSRNDGGVPDAQIGPAPVDIGAYEFQGRSCLADMNEEGRLSPGDFNAWILAYNAGDRFADQNQDGFLTPADFNAWTINFNNGCG